MANKNKNDKLIAEMLGDLIDQSEDTTVVKKYGKDWAMRPISSSEYLNALKDSQNLKQDEITRVFGMQIAILKRGLISVNGIVLTDEQKDKILNAISPVVLNTLYNEFEEIRRKNDEKLDKIENSDSEDEEETDEEQVEKPKMNTIDA